MTKMIDGASALASGLIEAAWDGAIPVSPDRITVANRPLCLDCGHTEWWHGETPCACRVGPRKRCGCREFHGAMQR